ncbi:hypothetical protein Pnap_2846 [Polaromonas naphthalenivorans CJ2]|uniref:Uncharacterized protein n=1 Tax=Polaromonas naphthalenivorans (strain CJ2) TaxID=365044 RepID=A1VR69_POLNA|nr:hypothetical protein Pnap_2846 [Polaromonas naphthalenivorans CJ2]
MHHPAHGFRSGIHQAGGARHQKDARRRAHHRAARGTLRDLKSRGSHQQLLADFEDYLNGFSPNVLDILENFKFRNQLSTLVWL